MDIILLERVENLGQMGETVSVKPGYARNYLLPQGKALRANKDNLAYFESRRAQIEADNLKRRDEAEGVATQIADRKVVLIRQAGESGQLYGSVTSRDIAEGLGDADITITRAQVKLDRPIKTLGLHEVRVVLHPEVSVNVTANVARSLEESELQAQGVDVLAQEEDEDEFDEIEELLDEEGLVARAESEDTDDEAGDAESDAVTPEQTETTA
ncbi:MAG: 50S ribosomal protein L9 [Pseudomonadota bacterium]